MTHDFRKDAEELCQRLFRTGAHINDRVPLDPHAIVAAALQSVRDQALEDAAKVAEETGNFGDYRRDELTPDYGQPKFDMMTSIVSAIRALKGKQP